MGQPDSTTLPRENVKKYQCRFVLTGIPIKTDNMRPAGKRRVLKMQNLLQVIIPFMLIIGVISGIVEGMKDQKKGKRTGKKFLTGELPYYAKQLMTEPEQILFIRLTGALPEYTVMGQVQLSRILGVKDGYNEYEWHNKINRMSADFVICDDDTNIIAVIELDDRSHQRESRRKADEKKDKSLEAAGIKVIRWNVHRMPQAWKIRKDVLDED
ncbi:DUF2726 domain-containing protein [Methylovulum psychrotolerans]|uniref:DUF2726 domain-containing protein n=1 Tax=Methylovulum psychrotolerans TaxID=1704499 RepID=UPI001BFF9F9C|nr:DUF2726 domain-containing protein [Methylovulum psychrotolerans]MBT9097714.1 DUF2726 domain-containing protein [Methylovulum psychrotolerans]